MSDVITPTDRDERTGRFLTGHKAAGPGRPVGARSKLGEAFVSDLRDTWERRGIEVLERCADEDPAALLRVVASLLPKDIDISVTGAVDVGTFAEQFRAAVALLGNEPPKMKIIEHAHAKRR